MQPRPYRIAGGKESPVVHGLAEDAPGDVVGGERKALDAQPRTRRRPTAGVGASGSATTTAFAAGRRATPAERAPWSSLIACLLCIAAAVCGLRCRISGACRPNGWAWATGAWASRHRRRTAALPRPWTSAGMLRHRRDVRRRRRRNAARRSPGRHAARHRCSARRAVQWSPRSTRTTPARRAWSPVSAASKRLQLDHLDLYLRTGAARSRCRRRSEGFERLRERRLIPALGRQQLRPGRPAGTGRTAAGRAVRGQPGLVLAVAPRRRVRPAALAARRGIMPLMAYSPIDQGALAAYGLKRLAQHLAPRRRSWRWPACWPNPA